VGNQLDRPNGRLDRPVVTAAINKPVANPAGTHLQVLLTPIAPLLDGSHGWPSVIDFDLAYMEQH
jgi:hypothetical protein